MKSRILYLTIFAMCLGCCVTGISASDKDLTIDLMFNHNEAGDEFDRWYDDAFGGGVGMTLMYNKYVGVRGSANYLKFTREFEGADFGIIRFNLDGRVSYPITEALRVFGQAGLGFYLWDADYIWWGEVGPEDGTNVGFSWGFGASYQVWEHIDVLATYTRHSVELQDTNDRFCWSELSLGVSFHLDPVVFSHRSAR